MLEFEEITVRLPDGYQAYARFWVPKRPRGAILYLHGIQSHCGWYQASAEFLAADYAVLQMDRRGSGRNSIDRGHGESAEQLTHDVLAAREELAKRSGFRDQHLVGVSWGGKLIVAVHATDPSGVLSLSLITPGLFPRIGASKGQMAKIGFAMLYESQRLFDIPLNDADLFTTEPKWRKFFEEDALTLHQCTAGFYLASRRMDKICARLGEVSAVPVHLLLADDERIIDNDKTVEFVRGLRWPTRRITTYRNARHCLEFLADPQPYFDDLLRFIQESR